jgi:hypothetical protein
LIPGSVTVIKGSAFSECDSLLVVNFELPSRLSAIRAWAFHSCRSLEHLHIVGSVSTNGDGFLVRCDACEVSVAEENSHFGRDRQFLIGQEGPSLLLHFGDEIEVVIPSQIALLNDWCFAYRRSLEAVGFEEGSKLTTIGRGAFKECGLPASLVVIGKEAFKECRALVAASFEAPSSLSRICEQGFCLCDSLASIAFPSSLVTLQQSAVRLCRELRAVAFESGSVPRAMHRDAFSECPNLDLALLRQTGRT